MADQAIRITTGCSDQLKCHCVALLESVSPTPEQENPIHNAAPALTLNFEAVSTLGLQSNEVHLATQDRGVLSRNLKQIASGNERFLNDLAILRN
jgi:hypothetical protein